MSITEAIARGIIDQHAANYTNKKMGQVIPLSEAIEKGTNARH